MTTERAHFDIVISGGSFVGIALARALTALAPGIYRIAIIERRPLDEAREGAFDGRSAAITASVKAMLEVIGVWPLLEGKTQAIERIELTDSALEAPIRPALLGLGLEDAPDGQPTAYILENADLRRALFAALEQEKPSAWFAPDSITAFSADGNRMAITLASGVELSASLLVAADGQNSALRRMAGIRTTEWRSRKVGIVATVGVEQPHEGVARQHFLPSGPFAILPMTGDRVSIVWTEDAAVAEGIFARGREAVLVELARRLGPELGALRLLSEPAAYPLTMMLARQFVLHRFALAGDAAHGLHWIAGQGLNHGLKDVAALAETLVDASRLGLDIGALNVLQRYERWRRFDSSASAFTAAALDTLFSNDSMALRMVRASGLRAVDRAGRLKSLFMKEAAGLTGQLPKLLQGRPL
jgi:2-octaprenyl-6-methoxyphenol hydroxylase